MRPPGPPLFQTAHRSRFAASTETLCDPEQRRMLRTNYAGDMKLERMKTMIALAWVLGGCGVAVAAHTTSVAGWTALVSLSVLPPLVLLRMWKDPAQTLSESISEARR